MDVDAAPVPTAKAVFFAALKIVDEHERQAYLDRACAGRPELRDEVERLLAADQAGPSSPLDRAIEQLGSAETQVSDADSSPDFAVSGHPTIDRYKLLEPIGEGGMGTVYMAEQTRPVRRRVALKLIKPGMDSAQVIARFEAERQALALMDHPNIAQVLDAGTTENGRPYFVMELVKGIPITDYCDKARLTIPERLELFVLVCRAVQHAHQKGIIHRDLKPSNILVTLHDGVPVPKVIDFGIAKATGQSLTDRTLFTGFAQMVGTPLYMSPEQAELSSLDVDTRSDVYSLGVLLYELLTGTTPFDRETFGQAALDEIRRIIREQDPPTPSSRLSTRGETSTAVSAARHTDPRRLGLSVRGELDWIVMRSLEKDRNRRYDSANALATDLRRHLDGEAVEAHPPSSWYRFGKLARRNRAALSTVAVVAVALMLGSAVSTWQAIRATRAEQRAESNFQQAQQAVDDYLTTVSESRLLNEPGMEPLRRELLETALSYYQGFLEQHSDDPSRRADLANALLRLSLIDSTLGSKPDAIAHAERARALFTELADDHPGVDEYRSRLAYSQSNLGNFYRETGQWSEAEASYRRALALREQLANEHPEIPEYRRDRAVGHHNLGFLYERIGRSTESEVLYRRAIELQERLAKDHPGITQYRDELAMSHNNLSRLYFMTDRMSEAETSLRRALELHERLADDHPEVAQYRSELAQCQHNLGLLYAKAGRSPKAEVLCRRALELRERLADDHPEVAQYRSELAGSHHYLANLYHKTSQSSEAETSYRRALELQERLADDHPEVFEYRNSLAACRNDLANIFRESGRMSEAEELYRRALEVQERLADDHPEQIGNLVSLGGSYCNMGHLVGVVGGPGQALEWYDRAEATLQSVLDREPHRAEARIFLRNTLVGRAEVRDQVGRHAEAAEDWWHLIALCDDQQRTSVRLRHARSLALAGEHAGAIEAFAALADGMGPSAEDRYNAACLCALAASAARNVSAIEQAEALAARAVAALERAHDAGYFDDPANVAHMDEDTDLDPIRDHPGYRALRRDLAFPAEPFARAADGP